MQNELQGVFSSEAFPLRDSFKWYLLNGNEYKNGLHTVSVHLSSKE